jgi:uncharacterized Zn finger protein
MPTRRKGHPSPDDGVDALVAQIGTELASGSRPALRRLLAQLVSEVDDLDGDGDGDGDAYSAPAAGADLDDDDPEEDAGPYWFARRAGVPQAPLRVDGGLVAKSKRGVIGESWWSQRFLAAVESAVVGGRLTRGRSYARRGQVIELGVAPGLISARVQGSRKAPYKVHIAMPVARDEQWELVLTSLASQAGYAAGMLAGDLPHEVEEVFAAVGVPMFPSRSSMLSTGCTCPDWANPCKHVAAVCYLVAERFDGDPFAVLAWRGRDRDEILRRLRELRGGTTTSQKELAPSAASAPALTDCIVGFWAAGPELASVQVRPVASEAAGAVLLQLPRGLLEIRGRDLGDLLGPAYKEMASAAQRRALG